MNVTRWALVAITILLLGCATTIRKTSLSNEPFIIPKKSTKKIVLKVIGSPIATESGDWEQLKSVWQSSMMSASTLIGSKFIMQHGDTIVTSEPGTLVIVKVKDYRYISEGARHALGAFIGNAYINSVVGFFDLETGTRFGVRFYNTSSSAWEGIFSAMTEKQIQAICNEIIADINNR